MKFLILTVLVSIYIKNVVSLDCYWNRECKYKYFSSKTPYEIVRGDIRDSIVKPKGCEPISIWAIMRHGKRNPSTKYAQGIKDVLSYKDFIISSYENGNSTLCAQDVENIIKWKIDKSILDNPNEIANEGYQELLGIGSRLNEAFPEILNNLQEEDYIFVPAFGDRMQKSADAFIKGLKNNNLVIQKANNDYSVVAPYSTCGKYQEEVFRNPELYYSEVEYMKTADYQNMKERVERKIGLNFTLSNNKITAIYDLCRYSWEGINNKPSPWCALFSVEDLKVLEYIGDLRHYYRNGYGGLKYSKVLGQMPLADLLKRFEQAKNGRGKKIVSYFTHATMLDMILVVLNLYKDADPLTGAHRNINRKWRSSFFSTFASNMIAVLHRCNKHGQNNFDYKIAFYWNEKPLLDMCNEGICSWPELEDKFKQFLNATTDICEFKGALIE